MTIYEQAFMKQDGEHARGAGRPGSPAGASLTQQTCTCPPTRADTHTRKHTPRRGSARTASPTGSFM